MLSQILYEMMDMVPSRKFYMKRWGHTHRQRESALAREKILLDKEGKVGYNAKMDSAGLKLAGFEPFGRRSASAVYALLRGGKVVYVGQAVNVFQRIGTHIRPVKVKKSFVSPGDLRRKVIHFDSIMVKWVAKEDLDQTERELIKKFNPCYNISKPEPAPKYKIDLAALGFKSKLERFEEAKRRKVV